MIKDLIIPTPGSIISCFVDGDIENNIVRKCIYIPEGAVLVELETPDTCFPEEYSMVNAECIIKIKKHSNTIPKKLNVYDEERNDINNADEDGEKYIAAEIRHCLRHMNIQLLTEFSLNKFKHEFNKSGYGMRLTGFNTFTNLNRKKFKKWLRQNVYKIMLSHKEQKQSIKNSEEYWDTIFKSHQSLFESKIF